MNDDAAALIESLISTGGDKKKVHTLIPALSRSIAELEQEYLVERERLRYPKDKEFTELDRKIMLEAAVSGLSTRLALLNRLYDTALIYVA